MLEVYTDMQMTHIINRTARPIVLGGFSVGRLPCPHVGSRLAAMRELGSRRWHGAWHAQLIWQGAVVIVYAEVRRSSVWALTQSGCQHWQRGEEKGFWRRTTGGLPTWQISHAMRLPSRSPTPSLTPSLRRAIRGRQKIADMRGDKWLLAMRWALGDLKRIGKC